MYTKTYTNCHELVKKKETERKTVTLKSVLCLQNYKLFSVYFLQDVDLLKNNTLENRVTSQCF